VRPCPTHRYETELPTVKTQNIMECVREERADVVRELYILFAFS